MATTFFLDIPVYRLSQEKYQAGMEEYIEKNLFSGSPETVDRIRATYEKDPSQRILMEAHLRKIYGGMWEFNEVIGHIKLHLLGNQIRGEYFQIDAKTIRRSRTKHFVYVTHKLAPEIEIPPHSTSEAIYDLVLRYVDSCRGMLKGKYVETSVLEIIGPHLNWKSLLHAHNNSLQGRRP